MRGVCNAALEYGDKVTALDTEMPPHSPETREGAAAFSIYIGVYLLHGQAGHNPPTPCRSEK